MVRKAKLRSITSRGGVVQPSALPKNQRGQGMIEYTLILVLVALVVLMLLLALGRQVFDVYSNVTGAFGSADL